MMKKLLNFLLIIVFQFGYMEWGNNNGHGFIFQVEAEIFQKAMSGLQNILHPFILIPLGGIIVFVITLFQPVPGRIFSLTGVACLSILMILLLFIGIINSGFRTILSTIPFWIVAITVLRLNWKQPPTSQ